MAGKDAFQFGWMGLVMSSPTLRHVHITCVGGHEHPSSVASGRCPVDVPRDIEATLPTSVSITDKKKCDRSRPIVISHILGIVPPRGCVQRVCVRMTLVRSAGGRWAKETAVAVHVFGPGLGGTPCKSCMF